MNMIEINLLPKNYQKKSFDFSLGKTGVYFLAAAAGIILLLITVSVWQNYQMAKIDDDIVKAKQRAQMLQKDIQMVDALTDVKHKVQKRMAAVESLDSHRSSWVRILEQISVNVPEFVWLAKFEEVQPTAADAKNKKADPKKKNAKAEEKATPKQDTSVPTVREARLEGYAFTLNALASFMIKMMRSDYFDSVELQSTEQRELQDKKSYNFVLTCNVHYLSDEDLRNMIASINSEQNNGNSNTSHKSLN